jgi:hypothetical protein
VETEDISRLLLTSLFWPDPEADISAIRDTASLSSTTEPSTPLDIGAMKFYETPSIFCCPSGFELLTPIIFANSARRLKPHGSWVIGGKLVAG